MRDVEETIAPATTLTIAGQVIEFTPLLISDWAQASRQALNEYKREYLRTFTANADLAPDIVNKILPGVYDRVAAMSSADLPKKQMRFPKQDSDGKMVLDGDGQPVMEEREEAYASWWQGETTEGQLYCLWLSMRRARPGLTHEDAEQLIMADGVDGMVRAAQLVADISRQKLGNPTRPPEKKKGRGRKSRRSRG